MGLVYIEGIVKHRGKSVFVRFLVDSGATYTVLTKSIWKELGLEPLGEMEFILADGTTIRRSISEAILELPGYGERRTPVVLGESEDENLLGIVTLEIFGLILDPFRRVLRPIRALMKRYRKKKLRQSYPYTSHLEALPFRAGSGLHPSQPIIDYIVSHNSKIHKLLLPLISLNRCCNCFTPIS